MESSKLARRRRDHKFSIVVYEHESRWRLHVFDQEGRKIAKTKEQTSFPAALQDIETQLSTLLGEDFIGEQQHATETQHQQMEAEDETPSELSSYEANPPTYL